jgi:hypothetical protein
VTGSGSNWPPDGFRWVETPGTASPVVSPPNQPGRSRRRWLLLVGAIVLAVVLAVGGVFAWHSLRGSDSGPVGTPKDRLISFSLEHKPVPGWRLSASDIGLPPEVPVGSLFASTDDNAYFVTDKTDAHGLSPMGWLYGVDIHTGKMLFPPIELKDFRGDPFGECYGNGPGVAVCLTSGDPELGLPQLVWVVDLEHGQVTFSGPTDLFPQSESGTDKYVVRAIGNYHGETRLVAARKGEGIYGIGPNAERTWFVPGGGEIFDAGYRQVNDIPPVTISMQNPRPSEPDAPYRVFSVLDGTDLTPTAPPGTIIRKALVYSGGFAYSFHESGKPDGLLFYDTAGKQIGRYQDKKSSMTPVENSALPLARLQADPAQWQAFSATGKLLLSFPSPHVGVYFKVIGTKIYADQGDTENHWQQWDLVTGASGPICELSLQYDYVGSDGKIVIVGGGVDTDFVQAVDPSTCATAWKLTAQDTGKGLQLWKVGTGLVQRTLYDLTELKVGG